MLLLHYIYLLLSFPLLSIIILLCYNIIVVSYYYYSSSSSSIYMKPSAKLHPEQRPTDERESAPIEHRHSKSDTCAVVARSTFFFFFFSMRTRLV